ncbi:MAG TPA: hypothetical protein VGB15_08530 [Longimicrobium sp.]|jgi:hypothetical protein
MGYSLGKTVFLSYRGKHFDDAVRLREWLVGQGMCRDVVLFAPNVLCAPNEVLMPYEYVEIMGTMRDMISRCNAFIFLNSRDAATGALDYAQSYFVQTELLQWRLYRTPPVVHAAEVLANGGFALQGPGSLEEASKLEKKLWAGIAVSIDRSQRSKFNPGFMGGKLNRNCYLVPCERCGEYFLVTKKKMAAVLRDGGNVVCPCTRDHQIRFVELGQRGNFYRKPIVIASETGTNPRGMRLLGADEVASLLVHDDPPARIPVLDVPGETLKGDGIKVVEGYLAMAGVAAVALGLYSAFDWLSNRGSSSSGEGG